MVNFYIIIKNKIYFHLINLILKYHFSIYLLNNIEKIWRNYINIFWREEWRRLTLILKCLINGLEALNVVGYKIKLIKLKV